jgi:hypothetical protein
MFIWLRPSPQIFVDGSRARVVVGREARKASGPSLNLFPSLPADRLPFRPSAALPLHIDDGDDDDDCRQAAPSAVPSVEIEPACYLSMAGSNTGMTGGIVDARRRRQRRRLGGPPRTMAGQRRRHYRALTVPTDPHPDPDPDPDPDLDKLDGGTCWDRL